MGTAVAAREPTAAYCLNGMPEMATRFQASTIPACSSFPTMASHTAVGYCVGPMMTRSTNCGISIPSSLSVGTAAGMLRSGIVDRLRHPADGLDASHQVWRRVHMGIVGDAPLKFFIEARVFRAGGGKEKHVKQGVPNCIPADPLKERLRRGNPADHIGEPLMKLGWCKIADRTSSKPAGRATRLETELARAL